jgi:HlyD family secretion protein
MRQRIIEAIIIILLLFAMVGGFYWYFSTNPQVWQLVLVEWERVLVELELATPEAEKAGITASGFIEIRQIAMAPEVSGRIARLMVDEGDQVAKGEVLIEIDADLLDAQIAEAKAAVVMAEAQLARVEAGARAEEIAVAEAAVTMAEAQRDAAYQTWQDAILLRDNPQELDLQIAAARSQIAVMEHRIQQMTALKDAAELTDDLRGRQVDIVEQGIDWSVKLPGGRKLSGHAEVPEGEKRQAWAGWNLATTDLWSAWVNLNQATAARDAAQQNLKDLLAMRDNPQQAQIQVVQAEATYQQAVAAVGVAKANLDIVRAGASQEQIDVGRTGLEQAQAALDALNVQRQKYTLHAPVAGMVLERIVHEGENALPGTTLLTLGSLDTVDLTIYIPEPDVGKVSLEQPVEVSVDSFPAEVFLGKVVWISDEAEFTPKNVQTKEERVNTVFAVKVRISNPDYKLKPGMPADAVLVAQ